MPLFENAAKLLRRQLEEIEKGNRVKAVVIGNLTAAQLAAINSERMRERYPPVIGEVLFLGTHVYRSRVSRDGYTIEDVVEQILSVMDETALVVATRNMIAIQNPVPSSNRYGDAVQDMVVFECTARYPRPELYSVIPKGDIKKPKSRP